MDSKRQCYSKSGERRQGYEGEYDEEKFGLLILDEGGSFLNSRDWNDPERRGLFRWITHARKAGWDVAIIVQDFEALDTQIRRSVCEMFVKCSRLDRIKLPFLPISLPRTHVATVRYQGPDGMVHRRLWARGTEWFKAYDTKASIRKDETLGEDGKFIDARGCSSTLSSWHVHGRYRQPINFRALPVAVIKWSMLCVVGALAGALQAPVRAAITQTVKNDWRKIGPSTSLGRPYGLRTVGT